MNCDRNLISDLCKLVKYCGFYLTDSRYIVVGVRSGLYIAVLTKLLSPKERAEKI